MRTRGWWFSLSNDWWTEGQKTHTFKAQRRREEVMEDEGRVKGKQFAHSAASGWRQTAPLSGDFRPAKQGAPIGC